MKKIYFIALFCCSLVSTAQKSTADTLIYTTTDVWPSYPQGYKTLYSFICANVNVPVSEIPTDKNRNTVYIKFVVEKDGSTSN